MSTGSIVSFMQQLLGSHSLALDALGIMIYTVGVLVLLSVFSYVFGWIERKIIAKAQYRHGPTYVGKYGVLQNLADLLKLLAKSEIRLNNSDKLLYPFALPLMLAFLVFAVLLLPFSPALQVTNLGLGMLIVFTIISFFPILVFIAGFSSGNKFADISAQRSVLMLISYELPLIFVIAAVALISNSFSFASIIASQSHLYNAIAMPIGFFVFFVVMLAEFERPPFDLREADSELIAGWLTDVSAPYYALALFLDYSRMFLGSLLITILFLGGWLGPSFLPSIFWLMMKATLLVLFIVVIRATTFRMRIDRVLHLGWVYLIPLSLINILITYIIFVR